MRENVGGADRLVRAAIGPALLVLGVTALDGRKGAPLGLLAMIGGALLAETAITRVCPVNELLGIDTARRVKIGAPLLPPIPGNRW
jgi:hypothetical protein